MWTGSNLSRTTTAHGSYQRRSTSRSLCTKAKSQNATTSWEANVLQQSAQTLKQKRYIFRPVTRSSACQWRYTTQPQSEALDKSNPRFSLCAHCSKRNEGRRRREPNATTLWGGGKVESKLSRPGGLKQWRCNSSVQGRSTFIHQKHEAQCY